MKKLILVFLLTLTPLLAERIEKGVEVCLVAHIEQVDGKKIPQRGIRIYQLTDGTYYGVKITNGREQDEFGGGSTFDSAMSAALAGMPSDVRNWNAQIDTALARIYGKTKERFAVLDGWTTEICVVTHTAKIDLVRENAGAYILFIAERDAKITKLKQLLDTIALEMGREQMAL